MGMKLGVGAWSWHVGAWRLGLLDFTMLEWNELLDYPKRWGRIVLTHLLTTFQAWYAMAHQAVQLEFISVLGRAAEHVFFLSTEKAPRQGAPRTPCQGASVFRAEGRPATVLGTRPSSVSRSWDVVPKPWRAEAARLGFGARRGTPRRGVCRHPHFLGCRRVPTRGRVSVPRGVGR